MWSSSLAAVALAAALEASPAQNTARGHDYAGKLMRGGGMLVARW